MSKMDFRSLQGWHEDLLQKQSNLTDEDKQDFLREVKEYIEQAKEAGTRISISQEREQTRANLRYWGNYVYGIEGVFPNAELAPSTSRVNFSGIGFYMLILLLLSAMVIGFGLGKFFESPTNAVQMTSTPKLTPPKIVELLNAELSNADALEQTLVAKYQVVDVSFTVLNGVPTVLRVDIRCECAMNEQCCIPEQMFAKTINAMKQSRRQVIEGVPETVIDMNVVCYDRVSQFAVMAASWSDVKDYLLGQINDYQFGSRIKRGNLP